MPCLFFSVCLDYGGVGSLLFKDTLCISFGAGCVRWKRNKVLVVIKREKNLLRPVSCALIGIAAIFSSVWGPLRVEVMFHKVPHYETQRSRETLNSSF